jgi:hypothetical protein
MMQTTVVLTDKQFLDRLQACILLRQQGYYSMASMVAKELCDTRPYESAVWHQIGQISTVRGMSDAALHSFAIALKLLQDHTTMETHSAAFQATSLGYAQSLMRLGRFDEAWPYWEAGRLHVSWAPWPTTEYWGGGPVSSKIKLVGPEGLTESDFDPEYPKSLLVQCEGGYGDIFMCLRWLPRLKSEMHIGRVGFMIFPQLYDFCDWSELGVDEVYRVGQDEIPFGVWERSTSIMSLPACFGVEGWGDIPAGNQLDQHLDYKKHDGAFRLGFCWRAEENSSPIRTKSLPLEVANEIGGLASYHYHARGMSSGIEILSLSPEAKDLYNTDPLKQPDYITYEPDRMATWRDTASYLCSMDFVLTVDTACAHLCGLLSVPCLVLVPRGGCWRWQEEHIVSQAWYGPQMTLYRQPDNLTWDAESIVESLMERLNADANTEA